MQTQHPFRRLLLKLSGETLQGETPFGIDSKALQTVVQGIKQLIDDGHEIAIVIGAGNIFRGMQLHAKGIPQSPADQMGMLGTIINGIALQQALEAAGLPAHLMSALSCPQVAENYSWQRARELLNHHKILIFVGGTGNPYFTTDSAAALRGLEIGADCLLKATQVDGIYSSDPRLHSDAKRFETISYHDILNQRLGIMDLTAIALCQRHHLPILVFHRRLLAQKQLVSALVQQHLGTLVQGD